VTQHPEACLGHVIDESFDGEGRLQEGPLKELVVGLAKAFSDWVHLIHEARALLAPK
jgi:hypothetical protein